MRSCLRLFLFLLLSAASSGLFARVNTIHISTQNPSCNGATDGFVTIDSLTTTAPSGNYTITVNTVPTTTFSVGDTVFNLTTRTYTITVIDGLDGNRRTRQNFTIIEPAQLVADLFVEDASCFGVCDGSIEAIADFGTSPYSFDWSTLDNKAMAFEDTITGLCIGTYTVTVTDANGCVIVEDTIIEQPTLLQPNVDTTDITCNGFNNGTATANPTSDAGGPFMYKWSSSANTNQTETGLGPGNHTVTVTDNDGCSNTQTFFINEPAALNLNLTPTTVNCFGESTGALTVTTLTGGTEPYTYNWSDGPITRNRTGIPAGTYTLRVIDNNGCEITDSETVTENDEITADSSVVNVDCFGNSTGSASLINITGGAGGYLFDWAGNPMGNGSANISNLSEGTYTVTITDALGCEKIDSVVVSEPSELMVTLDSSRNPTCANGSDGRIFITVSGGTPNPLPNEYSYSWTKGSTDQDPSGLDEGAYTVVVTDANNCTKSVSTTLTDPDPIFPRVSTDSVSCNGGNDGSANVVNMTGGTAPFTFQWEPGTPNGDGTNTITNLSEGNYSITITDANLCTGSQAFTIGEPANPIDFDLTPTQVDCNGESTGSITTTNISGGSAPYTFNWDDGPTSQDRTLIPSATYTLEVSDKNGCTNSKSIFVPESPSIEIDSSVTNVLCSGGNTGTAKVTVTGGSGSGYLYNWIGNPKGDATDSISELFAGTYSITIIDGLGCRYFDSVIVSEPSPIEITFDNLSNPLCANDLNGTINISVSGGTPNPAPNEYSYQWNSSPIITQDRTGLSAGIYTVTVTDANSCTAVFDTTLVDPDPITAVVDSITNVTCNGLSDGFVRVLASGGVGSLTYEWQPSVFGRANRDLAAGTYTITISDANGCQITKDTTLTEPQVVFADIAQFSNPTCAGIDDGRIVTRGSGGTLPYTYIWNPANTDGNTDTNKNLAGGTYSVTIRDANGCSDDTSFTLVPPVAINLTIDSDSVLCNAESNGKAWVTASGGAGSYTYQWDSNAADQITDTAFSLAAGSYKVTVTDGNGCNDTIRVEVEEPELLTATIDPNSVQAPSCFNLSDGQARVVADGGTQPYTYLWSVNAASQPTALATNLGAGTFTVTVTDANGCTADDQVSITAPTAILVDDSITNVACFGENTGEILLTVNGGTPDYTFDWGGSVTAKDRSGLTAGNYTVTIKDANNCELIQTYTVRQPAVALASIAAGSTLLCNGDVNGTASVIIAGGDTPYTIDWEGTPDGDGTANITGLAGGKYLVTITDSNSCVIIDSATVIEPDTITVTQVISTNESCDGSIKGTATATASGGTGNLTYNWEPGTPFGDGTPNISNLNPGNYSLIVSDDNNCTNTQFFTIDTDLANFNYLDSLVVDSCFGECLGFAGIFNISGGTAPYTYAWDDVDATDTSFIDSLCAGTYRVTITDANGCEEIETFIVTESPELRITSITTTPESCIPSDDGTATVNVTGGTVASDYTYDWELGGSATNSKTDYEEGDYTVTVTDDFGCSVSQSFRIDARAPFIVSDSIENVSCFGFMDGNIDLSIFPGVNIYTYEWENGDTTQDRSNLDPGDYDVTITGPFGCRETRSYEITEPTELMASVVTDVESCIPGNDGEAVVTATGGTLQYTYTWDGAGSNTDTNRTYSTGSYNVTVTDSNGCFVIVPFTIGSSATYTLSLDSIDVDCNGANSGEITVNTTATNPTFVWSDVSVTGSNPKNLLAGTYTVTVTDINNCSKIDSITINEPTAIMVSTVTTDASCVPDDDGTATLTVSGGTIGAGSDYTYTWQGGGSTTNINTGLSAGSYTVLIEDDNSCSFIESFTIDQSPSPTIVLDSLANVLCKDSSGGFIAVSGSGGVGAYTYRWTGGSNSSTQSDLENGDYTVTLTDSAGCTDVQTFTINEPSKAITIDFNRKDILCFGEATGSIDLTISGGTPFSNPDTLYRFQWDDGPTTEDRFNILAGNYTVTVTDSNNCTATQSWTVTSKREIVVDFDTVEILCNGASTGRLTATASEGNQPYTYRWSTGNTNSTIFNQKAGTYTVTVIDDKGCEKIATAGIPEPDSLKPNAIIVDETCDVGMDGSIDISNMTGGTPPYTFLWFFDSSTGDTLVDLVEGFYTVEVTDGNNCVKNLDFEIGGGANIIPNETIDSTSCFGVCDGRISVAPAGGVAPYSYRWSGPNGVPTGNAANDTITSLCAGIYDLTITDASNCERIEQYMVESPTQILANLSTTDETCNLDADGTASVKNASGGFPPYTFRWSTTQTTDSIFDLASGSYSVIIFDSRGCSDTTDFTINPGSNITLPGGGVVINDVVCNGDSTGGVAVFPAGGLAPYTYNWLPGGETTNILSDLKIGTYSVTITDSKLCSLERSFDVREPSEISATINTIRATCQPGGDGGATIVASGGTLVTNYTYTWSAGTPFNDSVADLAIGTYTVTVEDNNKCQKEFQFNIEEGADITLSSTVVIDSCKANCKGSISLTAAGGAFPYNYIWSSNAPAGSNGKSTITDLCAGSYTVTVEDNVGCTKIDTFIVSEPLFVISSNITTKAASCNPGMDGEATATTTGGTLATGSDYNYNWSAGSSITNTVTGLNPGDYFVTVTDDYGCSTIKSFTIDPGGNIDDNDSITDALCFGECTGKIWVTPTGGTSNYNYNWGPNITLAQGQGTDTIQSLCAGAYQLTITDAIGCTAIRNYTVGEGIEIDDSLDIMDESCIPGMDGEAAAINTSGGAPPFTFSWSTGGSGPNIIGQIAGDYDVTITDDDGCVKVVPFEIGSGNNLIITDTITHVDCNGASTGKIGLGVSGGVTPYTFGWQTGVATSNADGDTAILLAAGTYFVTVFDRTGCFREVDYTVNQPNELQADVFAIDESCSPGDDGSVSATVSGGTPSNGNYTYNWPNKGITTDNFDINLGDGTYTVTISDSNNCSITRIFEIGRGAEINDNATVFNALCKDDSSGMIALNPSGGQPNYTYKWDSKVVVKSLAEDTAKQLAAGSYMVTIEDRTGCSTIRTFNVGEPGRIDASLSTINESCSPGGDGSASVSATGGTGNLTYEWSVVGSGNSISGLGTGTYTVTVSDENDCDTVITFGILKGAEISPNGTEFNLECNSICDGFISLNPSGGLAPYSFQWETNVTTNTLGDTALNLCAGTYKVTITDFNMCERVDSFTVSQPDSITENLILKDASCSPGMDGEADASGAVGGTGALSYKWSMTSLTTDKITGISAGSHTLTITDINLCEKIIPFTIGSGSNITITSDSTDAKCFDEASGQIVLSASGGLAPYTYQWEPAVDSTSAIGDTAKLLKAGSYDVTILDNAGCSKNATFSVGQASEITAVITTTDESCTPGGDGTVAASVSGGTSSSGIYTFTWPSGIKTENVDSNLTAAPYNVTIQDDSACQKVFPFTIGKTGTGFTLRATKTDIQCNGDGNGSIAIEVIGGTSPFTYTWDPIGTITSVDGDTAKQLQAGTYTVTVEDNTGCTSSISETIIEPLAISNTLTPSNSNCSVCDGSISASPSGGTGTLTIDWLDANKVSIGQSGTSASSLCAGIYYAAVMDSRGCVDTSSTTVLDNNGPTATIGKEDENCANKCDGVAYVSSSCLLTTCTVTWTDALGANLGTTDTIKNLCPGTYFAKIVDIVTNCETNLQITIDAGVEIIPNLVTKDDGCNTSGVCEGYAKVSPTGGATPYTFNWIGPNGTPSGNLTDSIYSLCPGSYTVTITDFNLCDTVINFTINPRSVIQPNEDTRDESCSGAEDGSIALFPAGGGMPYTYNWSSNTPGGNVSSQTSLKAGTYTVTITEVGLCDTVLEVTLGTSSFDYALSKTDLSCNGANDGTANVSITGGDAGFSYNWDPAPGSGQSTANVSGLSAQKYYVTITNPTNCDAIDSVTINPNTAIQANASTENANCAGVCNGEIVLNPSGGAGAPYSYAWSNITTDTSSQFDLCADTYTVTITDAASCTEEFSFNILNTGAAIVINLTKEDLVCGNICDGRAFVSPTGGVTPYTYEWSSNVTTGQFTDTASQLCIDNYSVTVFDANGCSSSENFSIVGPAPITANFNSLNSTCNICDGELDIVASGGDGNYTYEWFDASLTPLANSDSLLDASCAGVYYVDVTDGLGCKVRFNGIIDDNGAESLSTNSTDANCNGSKDGQAEVSFTCSDPTCSIEWYNTTTGAALGVNTEKISGLAAGDYHVQVTNNSGCKSTRFITIEEPSAFSVAAAITDANCHDGCNGAISVSVAGSNGGYSYNWGPGPLIGQGTNSISNLCAGTYELTITDVNLCDTMLTYTVGQPGEFSATFTTSTANCGDADGIINATINGGTVAADYEYQWFDGNNTLLVGETNPIISNIEAGAYALRVRDDNVCEERFPTLLANTDGPIVVIDSIENAGCFEDDQGAIYVTATGVNTPLSYKWLPQGQTTADIVELTAGTYSLQVTDASNCIGVADTTISEFGAVNASFTTQDATCGQCNGEASVVALGRIFPYTYFWSNGQRDTTNVITTTTALCAGLHTVVITDGRGCSESFDFSINTDGGPSGEIVAAIATSCATSCDGSVTVTPSGGVLPYTYLWQHNGATTNSLNNLCKGTYYLQVADANGCSRNVEVEIDSPNELVIDEEIVGVGCGSGSCDGSILLTTSGGSKPYSYDWNPSSQGDTNYISNLCVGVYNVTVTDANGCSDSRTITVSNDEVPTAIPTVTDASCNGLCDGTLVSNVTPSASISYVWLNDQGLSIARPNTDVNSACAGNYVLEVTTIPEGCISYIEVEVEEPDSITLSASIVKNISCPGECDGEVYISSLGGNILYTFSWNDPNLQTEVPAKDLCAGTYGVTVEDANGCSSTASVTLQDPVALIATINSSTSLGCSSDCDAQATSTASGGSLPYTFNWSGGQLGENPTDLCFGENILTVIDGNGCMAMDTVLIAAADTVQAIVGADTTVCDGDSIHLRGIALGSTVTSAAWYLSDSTTLLTRSLDTSLLRGVGTYAYVLIVRNNSGCEDIERYTVPVVPNPEVGVQSSIQIFKDEVATFNVSNQDVSYSYLWTPDTDLNDATLAEPTSSTRETITYTLTVTDTNNCTYIDSLDVLYAPEIEIPSGLSPNGDGMNDVWNIQFLDEFPNASVQIYNRWGELLYEETNGYRTPWDGTYEGKALPIGTYYYVIDFHDSRFKPITGPITIVK